jgi:iron complex outermembrane receptor protein
VATIITSVRLNRAGPCARPLRVKLRPLLGIAAALLAICICSAPAEADSGSPTIGELKQLNVEDLMNIQVTSVARHPEKLIEAASAIQVITQEDIRRSGATSIPEALRLADNLQVAQKNSHDWAISARGFNANLGNKLLVMIDGRTVYTPLYSGVFWDVQDYLLEDIDRIEVISGPGGALWGANAVNGVINIITKSAADTQGLYAEAGGGSQPQDFAGARFGGTLAPGTQFRVYGKYFNRNSEVLDNGNSGSDAWRQGRGGFRVDSERSRQDRLTVQGDVYGGREATQMGGTLYSSGDNLLARWSHELSEQSDLSLQSYFDQTHLTYPVAPLVISGQLFAPGGTLHDDLDTYDVDFQHRFGIGAANRLVWGLGFRRTHDVVGNTPPIAFFPAVLDHNLYSAFVQDEIRVRRNLSFTLGTKLEHNDYTGFEVEPDARLSWSISSNQAVWAAISRAVRTPSRLDRDLTEPAPPYPLFFKGRPNYTSESVIAYELGLRAQLTSRFTTSLSGFYNAYDHVRSISATPNTLLPFYWANNLAGNNYGLEFSGNFQVSAAWSLHTGYTWLKEQLHVKPGQFDLNNARYETADPEHQLSLRSSLNLPGRVELDAGLRWVDTLRTATGTVPSYVELDTRLAWQAGERLELSIVGQNLLHNHHLEYGTPDSTPAVEIQRSIYGRLAWRY